MHKQWQKFGLRGTLHTKTSSFPWSEKLLQYRSWESLLSKYFIHFLCLVLKMVAKKFSSTLNQGFRQSFYVLWTPLPASRPLHLNNLHHTVPCAPDTIMSNLLIDINLTLLKERENLLRDLIIFNLQRMNLIHFEEYFIPRFFMLGIVGFFFFWGEGGREKSKRATRIKSIFMTISISNNPMKK